MKKDETKFSQNEESIHCVNKSENSVAVIGMACRFPGAKDYHQFWDNLEKGINSITEVPSNRWDVENFYSANPDEPNKSISKWGGFIEDIDKFDPMFFGISPREAMLLDPQQRLMLELSWSCLEDSGYSPAELSGTNLGVFVGVCNFDYKELLEKYHNNIEGHTSTGTYTSIIPNRISYFFNFHGLSVPVDTACSSSLVAIHQAINALKENECAMALVGGVNVLCTPTYYISFSKLGMLSPQGQCKTFDAKADGYVRGEGAGVILLKPLKNAIKDKDYIYGVIRGSAVNHGGAARTLTSPNAYAQSQVIRSAYTKANILPNTVSYIEAHGTGTPLGDPIEINGLKRAFIQLYQQYGIDAANEPYCGLSTVKTNIGHLESAAGIAGIIKVLLAMKHKKLPKITNYQHLNPRIKLDGSPFYIVEQTQDWQQLRTKEGDIIPRRAGVSSFGFGGVNAHVVLEEAPALLSRSAEVERSLQLLTLSAKSEKALLELAQSYENFFATNPDSSLADICFTANLGRSHFEHRLALVTESTAQLREQLRAFASGEETIGLVSGLSSSHPKIAFLFTGQGSQYVGMGRLLYETQPTFRAAIDRCDEILQPYLELPLLSVLYPQAGETSPLDETAYTQPALFALEYALGQLWKSWGIGPDAVMGHSVGEYVAACVAGVFSLEDGLKLIASRGRLMQALPQDGEMVAVLASQSQLQAAILPYDHLVSIAAHNGSRSFVISGQRSAIRAVCATLEMSGVKTKPLQVSHAFHSPLMEPMLKEFERVAQEITYSLPKISIISNVTGQPVTSEITTAQYWVNHVRYSVRFATSMETLHQQGYEVFVEIGAQATLLGMGRQCLPEDVGVWLPSLRQGQSDWQQILQSLGELYVRGVPVDWSGFDKDYPRRRVVLPTYPFQRQRYWIQTTNSGTQKTALSQKSSQSKLVHPLLGHRLKSALNLKEIVFESQLSSDLPAYLKHHRVFERAVVPGAAYVEMAASAGAAVFKSENLVVEEVLIQQALILPEDEVQTLQMILTPGEENACSFKIYSLVTDDEQQEDSSWKLHTTGKIVVKEQKSSPAQKNLAVLRTQGLKEISVETFYQKWLERGIDYGSSFRAIEQMWAGDGEALGRIQLPEALVLEAADYNLHPVLLDACFQVVMAAFPDSVKEQTYMPIGIERLRIYRRPGFSVWSHALIRPVLRANEEALTADVWVVDETGVVVVEVEGISFKRTRHESLLLTAKKPWQDWLYQVEWRPHVRLGLSQNYLPASEEIAERLAPQLDELMTQLDQVVDRELLTHLEALSLTYVLEAFEQMGWKFQIGNHFSTATLAEQLGIVSQHHRLLNRLLEMLMEEGMVRQSNEGWEVIEVLQMQNTQAFWSSLSAQYPIAEAELTLLNRCASKLAEVLRGKCDPLQLLFPEADVTTAATLYQNSPTFGAMNVLVQKAVLSAVEHLPQGRGVRILEIGAGTGGTTSYILPHLSVERTEYVFTDIGAFFTTKAQEKFRNYPFVRYQVLNIEQDPESQGFDSHQFDIIVAANVLHASSNLRDTLQHVQKLLSPGGMVVLLEGVGRRRWIDLIFGLTEGWWKFADLDLRPDYPLLSASGWQELLKESGFKTAATISPDVEKVGCLFPQAIIVAQGVQATPEVIQSEPGQWLILADNQGIGYQLAARLQSKGEVCTLVFRGKEYEQLAEREFRINPAYIADFQRLFEQIVGTDKPLVHGAIHLWSLDTVGIPLTAEDLQAAFQKGCGSTLHLVQALVNAKFSETPKLWLVSKGAVSVGLESDVPGIAQAPLWGMGKVIALEHPELKCVRVDLDPEAKRDEIEGLFEVIWSKTPEDQLAFRDNILYMERLARYHSPLKTLEQTKNIALSNQPFQLEIASRGILENLKIEPTIRRQPGIGEVEIRVRATGLNFKDVLNVLGLLGEQGLLGLECAGEVVATGKGVEDLDIGNRVVALVSGGFSNYVTVKADMVALLPKELSFEEGTTIPVAFLTAYYTLHHLAKISAKDRVLIHAAAGGVGLAAIQLAQQAGAEIFATASPNKWEFLKSLGVKHIMNSRTLDFADEVMTITEGQGVDIVLNCLTGEFISKNLSVLKPKGRFLEIGKTDVWEPSHVAQINPNVSYYVVDLIQVCQQEPALIQLMLHYLMQEFQEGKLKPLPQKVFSIQDVVSAFTYMQQAKHIGKIVVSQSQESKSVKSETITFRKDSTYLVTGGLGGLGLLVAQWMVEQGANHLVLVGRSESNQAVNDQLRKLEQAGAQIKVAQADVSVAEQLAGVLAEIEQSLPPLRGIVHAAGVLDNGVLLQQNWERFTSVMAPKVEGAWNLHTLTQNLPIDFFVMFSSIASLLGSPGLANHAAANAFLDALAYFRRSRGMAGSSINWGAWSEVGAVARRQVGEHWRSRGIETIAPVQGLEVLKQLFSRSAVQVGVAPINWQQFLKKSASPFFADFSPVSEQPEEEQVEFSQLLAQTPVSDRRTYLMAHVCSQLAKILGFNPSEAINLKQGFFNLGMDSLTSLELRNRLQTSLRCSLPSTLVFDYPTVELLVDYLAREVLSIEFSSISSSGKSQQSVIEVGDISAILEELSEDELADLLAQELAAIQQNQTK